MTGYSNTPLQKKLGIKPGLTVFLYQPPEHYFEWIDLLPGDFNLKSKPDSELDFVHLFASDQKSFESNFLKSKKHLKKNGMIWISWPKKTSKIATDLNENIVRDFGLANGLVDVKVCAVDETWSGLKFVFRIKDRK
jgi:hypothetical protein